MKKTKLKRLTACLLALSMCLTTAQAVFADAADESGEIDQSIISADDIDASNRENAYSAFLERNADAARPDREIYIYGKDYVDAAEGTEVSVETVDGVADALKWSNQSGQITFEVDVPEAGLYCIEAMYEALEGNTNTVEFTMAINGEIQYTTASRITLPKVWVNKTEIEKDIHDNDIRPGQIESVRWQTSPIFRGIEQG